MSKTLAYLRKFSYLLAWFAVSTGLAFMLTHQGGKLADNEQLLTAKKLSADKDPMLEFLFPDLAAAWANDSTLNRMVFRKETEDQEINSYIRNTYLSGYLSKYETELTTCLTTQNLLIQPENRMMNCIEYFRSLAALRGDSLKPNGLFLLENNLLGVHYVGYLILTNRSGQQTDSLHLFVEFYFKYIPEGTGYPDLLIDSRKGIGPDLNKYSFASYRNGVLYYKFGGYFYPLRLDQITTADDGFFCREGFRHAILKYDDKTLIISRKEQSWAETLAPFSFFLLINGLLLTLMVWVANGFPDFRKTFVTFRTRLQLIISVSLIASFTVIGIISAIYLADIYRKKNDDFLAEKTQSLIVELEHKLKDLPLEAGSMRDYLNQILLKFSMVFFTDINLYGVDGKLLATSRPEIFAMGLTGDLMHPGAFRAMRLQNRLYLRQYEEIGKARFISSYAPFKNTDGEIIAFVNLPYFVRESEMQREISSILLSYLNIFLLLSSVSLLFALFVSRRLTQPLQMIQQKMSKLQLGHTNEKIQYQRFDEIGELVNQYNTLLDQLAASAELLARSERESAWREMARQVAHEIKNPLTPMRLSVQYLIRALDNNDPDIDQKIRNISQTLISQIDTLSSIASSFSDFAVMPQPKPVKLDLSEVLQKIVNLFDHQENITFGLQISASTPAWIEADPENLNRIFINLIKNSIQAIGNKPQARITVRLSESTTAYLVEVEDTGKGMTEEEARKVFSPNFTTKSSGMGMGLSIVHSLVQQAGGKIDFNTRPGQGTTFQIELPRAASPA
ncbi:MAG: HAMP domain-containing histidine kinase [Bacteroidetes bacterium]|nr:HAMP domain-containing histidine kinase [Bacteroidota bacterium]